MWIKKRQPLFCLLTYCSSVIQFLCCTLPTVISFRTEVVLSTLHVAELHIKTVWSVSSWICLRQLRECMIWISRNKISDEMWIKFHQPHCCFNWCSGVILFCCFTLPTTSFFADVHNSLVCWMRWENVVFTICCACHLAEERETSAVDPAHAWRELSKPTCKWFFVFFVIELMPISECFVLLFSSSQHVIKTYHFLSRNSHASACRQM